MNSAQGNDSQAESPLIPELIARQAALDPDAVAVVAGRERLTYGELHRRAELAAHRLRQLGAGPDTPVGVRHGRGFDLVVGLLAIWRAGSAYLPLDPEAPQARLRALIDRSGTRLVLCEADQADAVTAAGARAVVPAHLVDDPSRGPGQRADLPPAPSLHRHNTAYVLHTSGSTGEPKGVMVSHEGAGNLIRWMVDHFGFGPGTRVLHRTPLIFDAHVWEVFAPLAAGGTLVLADAGAERDPAALVRAVAEHGVTTLQVVPSILRLMVAEDGWDRCHALRQVLSGGEQLHAELAQRLRALVDVDVWNTYGPTECSVNATAHRFDPAQSEGPVPIGRPIPGTRVLVVDATGTPVGIGVPGELLIGGAGLARGYLGRPGQTADRFVPDPYAKDASRLYRTGDRVRWTPDGVLEYLGRTDDQIKVNGVRIEPGEIESHLLDHPQVVMGTVLPYRVDDGGKRLAAYVVPASDDAPEQIEQTLRRYLLERLPASHLPSRFLFLDRLPIGPTGKVDRKALPDPAADSAATGADATVTGPAADSAGASASGPAGSGEALALVADIWRDVLGVTEAAPGDDFFRLGGTSLQIALLATRLRAAGQDITLYDLLSNPTLAAQAALLDLAPEAPAPGTDIPRLAPETRAKGVPLSPGQRRMWFLDRLNPGSPEWVAGLLLRLPEGADLPVVREALGILTDRHEALRTRYTEVGGEPAQFVRASVETPLTTVNCTRAELPAELKTLMGTGFPLDGEGPLLRGTVYRVDGGPRLLVLAMHHITTDGWSSRILEDDFHRTVDALLRGERPELPELPVQYADYAAWQQERLTSGTVEREVAHWRGVLAGVEPLSPPTDHPRPPMRDGRGSIAPLQVPAATVRALDSVAQELGTTRFAVVLTALATVLARYTGQWDVPVGAPVAGRGRPELDGVVGFFLNTVVMRCRLEPELGFTEAVRRTAEVTKDALAHQELPFDLLVDELAPKRDLSRTPLYQVAFDLHGEDFNAPDDEDLEILHRMWHLAHTDLTLLLRPQPDGSLVGGLEYATSLYEHSTATALVAALGQVLESAAAEPRGRLDRLALLGSDETRRLDRWSGSPARQPEHPAHVLIAEQALRTPDAIAVRADDGELTYRQLAQRAGQVGDRLRALGVRPDTPVGVLLDRGLDLHPALLGAWWAGAAYVPIDPEFPAERVAGMLADAGVRVLLTDERGAAGLADTFAGRIVTVGGGHGDGDGHGHGHGDGHGDGGVHADSHGDRAGDGDRDGDGGAGTGALDALPVRSLEELAARARATADLDALAYVIYTSGSTGRPKGVAVHHRGLTNHLLWARETLVDAGTGGGAVFSSVAFDLVVPNLWAPLLAGQRVVLLPQDLDLSELGTRLVKSGPFSFLKLTPGHLDILSQQLGTAEAEALAATVVVAGEALPGASAAHWTGLLGEGRLINEYGPTEASVGTSILPVPREPGPGTVPIGRPLPGMTMRVLDASLAPVPVGAVGELYVGGTGVARGYLGRAGLTAERFLPDPYGPPGSRMYRSGDLVRLRDGGVVEFLGRGDDQIKIRGYRVETGEIRTVLLGHPAVADAVVLPRGEGGQARIVAYWTARDGRRPEDGAERAGGAGDGTQSAADAELAAHCARQLPDYMVPSAFVRLDAIPLNRNGKVDRAALPEPAGPDPAADDTPLGPVEEIVQHIWREVCGVEAGAHDDFFGRGGNSILAIRMIAEIRTEFDVTLPVRAVFEAPTIAGIARTIENRIRAEIEEMSDSDIVANTDTDTDTGSDAVPDTGTDTDTGSDADSDTGTGSDASAAAGAQTTNTSTAPSTSTSTDSAYAAAQAKEPNA